MTNLRIKIIDIDHNTETGISDLTDTGCEMLLHDCKQLLSDLEDKLRELRE
jgi:hypothetical protein